MENAEEFRPKSLDYLRRSHAGDWLRQFQAAWEEFRFSKRRGLVPPPGAKRRALLGLTRRFGTTTFVETGTYFGGTVAFMRAHVSRIVSIELDTTLWRRAQWLFAKDSHIQILHGDSGDLLPSVCDSLHEQALFWLDGHYSGEETAHGRDVTPIQAELQTILWRRERHLVVIDDAREFGVDLAYPAREELEELCQDNGYSSRLVKSLDQFQLVPR